MQLHMHRVHTSKTEDFIQTFDELRAANKLDKYTSEQREHRTRRCETKHSNARCNKIVQNVLARDYGSWPRTKNA